MLRVATTDNCYSHTQMRICLERERARTNDINSVLLLLLLLQCIVSAWRERRVHYFILKRYDCNSTTCWAIATAATTTITATNTITTVAATKQPTMRPNNPIARRALPTPKTSSTTMTNDATPPDAHSTAQHSKVS
ncbi:unnamed protein product [Ceratitis capitata]|uniref:(Mediterranean fruit fly) hypothetical protein n=1 Tax=Ceratitis capitata TaxID=7213 RepID=A0A811VMY6_CERCA|nr:unnamed protein product [Ceratitis capitata]